MTPRVGRPPTTSREAIVERALAMLDANGVDGLTMRELAADVGVTPMALYRHVGDKESLLALALDSTAEPFAAIEFPADPRQCMLEAMSVVYDTLVDRPWVPQALTVPQRIGRGALRITDAVVGAGLELTGDAHEATRAYRALWSMTLGSVLTTIRLRSEMSADGPTWIAELLDTLPSSEAPQLRASLADPTPPPTREDFRHNLSALIAGLFGP
ncbi:TetR/AcrR family transcriptional regulator [Tsukamurella sp. 8F]|uniref:TetR/AcrR family transcriptional regulator n=1 Tax=unclassified Tsukamurella TaxID=2633480 RepID=UPI0023B921F9|nr:MULTISPECIES: TetR/AcrR family transcriptional regulator [unclassified Tsukamurella]MDF0531434.1 TetR/AcrR family transcriptional regulator [Tsukamurella sp. 8J]MDF0587503.1 TetR/AcrR family transcriptional regulator [Tsukamurella sp. 8F]